MTNFVIQFPFTILPFSTFALLAAEIFSEVADCELGNAVDLYLFGNAHCFLLIPTSEPLNIRKYKTLSIEIYARVKKKNLNHSGPPSKLWKKNTKYRKQHDQRTNK